MQKTKAVASRVVRPIGKLKSNNHVPGNKKRSIGMGKGAEDSDRPDVPTRMQRTVSVIITPSTLAKQQEEPDPQEQIKDRDLISPEEEKVLEELLASRNVFSADTSIEEFTLRLTNEVAALEAANIHALLSSSAAIQQVIKALDEAAEDLEEVDTWMSYYDNQLGSMQKYIKKIEDNNNKMEIITRNHNLLAKELYRLLDDFSLDQEMVSVLTFGDLEEEAQLELAGEIAEKLEARFESAEQLKKESPELAGMEAIKSQVAEFERLRDIFAGRLKKALEMQFTSVKELVSTKSEHEIMGISPSLPTKYEESRLIYKGHEDYYERLRPYTRLMHWLERHCPPNVYSSLCKTYLDANRSVYQDQMHNFFSGLRRDLQKEAKEERSAVPRKGTDESFRSSKSREGFRYALGQIVRTVFLEQTFCEEFFHFSYDQPQPDSPSIIIESSHGGKKDKKKDRLSSRRSLKPTGVLLLTVKSMLQQMFSDLPSEIENLLASASKADYLALISYVADIETYMRKYTQDSGYLIDLLSKDMLYPTKTLFDRYVEEQIAELTSTQPSIKRCGVLPVVHKFPGILSSLLASVPPESKMAKNIVDAACVRMFAGLMDWLLSLQDLHKEKAKYIVRIENFSVLLEELSGEGFGNISATYAKQVKAHVDDSIQKYVDLLLRSKKNFAPMVTFFEGMDNLLRTLPPEEIQFQSSHSAEAYQRMIANFSKSKISKKVEEIKDSIKKSMSKESNMASPSFIKFKDHFLTQYAHWEGLMTQCYKHQKLPCTTSEMQEILSTY